MVRPAQEHETDGRIVDPGRVDPDPAPTLYKNGPGTNLRSIFNFKFDAAADI